MRILLAALLSLAVPSLCLAELMPWETRSSAPGSDECDTLMLTQPHPAYAEEHKRRYDECLRSNGGVFKALLKPDCSSLGNERAELAGETVDTCMASYFPRVHEFYRKWLGAHAQESGTVVAFLKVDPAGRIVSAMAQPSSTASPAFREALLGFMAELVVLPRSAKGWEGEHTFSFGH